MVAISFLEPFVVDALVYGSLFALMSIGLTLTYMTTKVPNFAHGSFVTVGVYLAFSLYHFQNLSPYYSVPISFLLGGAIATAMYLYILRPLSARGSSFVSLMISTLAVDIAFIGVFGIYSDLLSNVYGVGNSKFFVLIGADFQAFGTGGLALVAPLSVVAITGALWILLTKTRFGIAMRAAVENPNLAGTLGINIQRVYVISWFIAGGLAALAGSLLVLWLPGNPHVGSDFIVAIFAASILGGLSSIYGAVIGGLIVGSGEILATVYGTRLLGSWFTQYQVAIPMVVLALVLLFLPEGIVSLWGTRIRKG